MRDRTTAAEARKVALKVREERSVVEALLDKAIEKVDAVAKDGEFDCWLSVPVELRPKIAQKLTGLGYSVQNGSEKDSVHITW